MLRKLIISLPLVLATILTAVATLVGVQQEAYAQAAAFYSEPMNEQQQALISEILNRLQNQTASDISIFEDGSMYITWSETITAEAPDGRVFEIEQHTSLTAPHNFTIENGYTYRDGTIFAPNGTELFASE
jgi:hypothetical protein